MLDSFMKSFILLLIFIQISICSFSQKFVAIDYVNPLMGNDSKFDLSNGNTSPLIALPWGMNFWTPQTAEMDNTWMYAYDSEKIQGFKQTHQPSPWIGDYGQFSLFPLVGQLKLKGAERASWFSHKAETACPNYYSVYLADYDVKTEITPTERAACFRFTFPQTDSAYVLVDAFDKGSMVKILPNERKIIGYSTRNSGGVPENFRNYFVVVFDHDSEQAKVWENFQILDNKTDFTGNHVGAALHFKTKRGEQVIAKVASSFISFEQAEINLKEIGNANFEAIKRQGEEVWNKALSRIAIEGGSTDQMKTLYSCLYRTMLFPRKFYEINKAGETVHYSPYNGKVLPGYMFTDNGFWDTFRAVFPFFNLMFPSLVEEIQAGLVNAYNESGFLPEWASPGHRDCMIGSNSA